MTALLRGELIKTATTRTLFAYAAIGVALVVANVLIVTQFSSELDHVSDKREAIAGLPILLLLLGLVGAAGEYRHRTAGPAALAAGRGGGRLLLARAGAYAVTGLAVALLLAAVSLAIGLPLLASEPGTALGFGDVARSGRWESPRRGAVRDDGGRCRRTRPQPGRGCDRHV